MFLFDKGSFFGDCATAWRVVAVCSVCVFVCVWEREIERESVFKERTEDRKGPDEVEKGPNRVQVDKQTIIDINLTWKYLVIII